MRGKAKVIGQEIERKMTQEFVTEEMVCWMFGEHQVLQDLPSDRKVPVTQKRQDRTK